MLNIPYGCSNYIPWTENQTQPFFMDSVCETICSCLLNPGTRSSCSLKMSVIMSRGGQQWSADPELKYARVSFRCYVIGKHRKGICAFWLGLCGLLSP